MNEVSRTDTNALADFSIRQQQEATPKNNELGQRTFLELMITQLKNQDPLSPQDNTEFVAQLAQFSSVESLDRLTNNFETFTSSFTANQALQASSLVGRSVTVPGDTTRLAAGDLVSATAEIPASASDVGLTIYDANGALVDRVSLGARPAGEILMRWDGRNMEIDGDILDRPDASPEGAAPGRYRFEFTADVDGQAVQLDTGVSANVNSVTLGPDGTLVLNLAEFGAVNMSDVRQFNE